VRIEEPAEINRGTLYTWLDRRLNLKSVERTLPDEPIPGGGSWIYVFDSATIFLFLLQAVTGMFLAVYYAPTPDHAYDSNQFIEETSHVRRVAQGSDELHAGPQASPIG
jgi:quinol-cytochrome oxidoreductase complex cytochrome b subunit